VAAQQGQRRSHLSLTREQMLEAQEMFRYGLFSVETIREQVNCGAQCTFNLGSGSGSRSGS